MLCCERGDKYRKYKSNIQPSVSDTRKCDYPFKLRDKPICNVDGWVLKVMCGYHYPFAGSLKSSEHYLLVYMSKSQIKFANILLALKENNECNATTIKQLYNARYTYKRSLRGSKSELQHLMMVLECDNYIY